MDPSKAHENLSRLCQLLVDKGGDALRAALHAIHPPSTLASVLNANKPILQQTSVINHPQQWNVLFPTSGIPDSNNFDITLLTILLRNICGLPSPATGWNVMPPAGDTSKSADVVRIKLFRNEVCGHTARAQLDNAKFETLWQEVSKPLTRLGIPQKDIDEIKVASLSPKEECYVEKLMEREPTSCLPDKLPLFTGREVEIQNVIALLKDEGKAVVSLHGGPGFGKTAIAIRLSHQLSEDHNIPVVFSQLTTATTIDEMVLRLCRDVGVNHEDDPKSSLILWLKNKKKVILVMDNIDNLLENKTSFYEFVRLLRKNSNQNCQILTTSRMSFEIRELLTDQVQVNEMDGEECIELLKKQGSEEDDQFLRKLAELCGNIPLAMCIASPLVNDFEDPDELLHYLEKQPMKTLECPESDQYVNRAINMSYEKCSDEDQEAFVRLSVFEGSFSEDAARVVTEKDELDTSRILKKLVSRSLIKQPTKHRYSIHLLIKYFLKDKQKSEERRLAAAMRAELLMVKYYLKLAHQLTMKSYSKDGYKDNREALKREVSNIQNVLKICSQQEDPEGSDISDCLAHSKIYTSSAKFFSLFVRTIIPGSIIDEFLQQCAKMAEARKQHAIKFIFDCVLAYQERSKTIGKTDEDFNAKMEEIKKEFETHYKDLKEDKSLCAHYYSQYGEYLLRQAQSQNGKGKLLLQIQARDQLQKSLELRETLTGTSVGKADKIFSLKLAESDEPTLCKTKVYTSLAIAYNLVQEKSDAVRYAKKAMEFDRIEKIIRKYEYAKLEKILQY